MRKLLIICCLFISGTSLAQPTHPINGTTDKTSDHFLLYNGVIHVNAETSIPKGSIEIKEGKIVAVQAGRKKIKGAVEIDLNGKHVYPSFVDIFTDYGVPKTKDTKKSRSQAPQLNSQKKGAYSWNQAIIPEFNAGEVFTHDVKAQKAYLHAGFGTVVSHRMDGISRGTGVATTLLAEKENKTVLNPMAAAFFSFSKGSSKQSYPSSLMGSIALLRQTYLDAQWYNQGGDGKERNLSLDALISNGELPQIFDAGNYLNILRANRIGEEFDANYILKGKGDSYKRVEEIKATGRKLIVPLYFPKAIDATDPYETMLVSLKELKEWELAPANAAILHEHGVDFAFTTWGLKKKTDLLTNLRKAVEHGLPKQIALAGVTSRPANFLNLGGHVGQLKGGLLANFLITSKDIFEDDAVIRENWVQGKQHIIKEEQEIDIRGRYDLKVGDVVFDLDIKGKPEKPKGSIKIDTGKTQVALKVDHRLVSLSFDPQDTLNPGTYRLSGQSHFDSGIWEGKGIGPDGDWVTWSAIRNDKHTDKKKKGQESDSLVIGNAWLPSVAYGRDSINPSTTILIKNATIWTNEQEGIIENASLVLRDGKIAEIGSNIIDVYEKDAIVLDGTGMHITSGIIDEHSHIAISGGVNESGQAVAAEVRIGDVVNPDDVNIYRQLAGGVTAAQLLHGSANPVGGQSALVKLKWGAGAEAMKIDQAPGFIKFALGENVKQSNWGDQNVIRFPQTRMGVEQVFYDGFIRAREYEKIWADYREKTKKKKVNNDVAEPRRDLELETLLEILNKERFITCHSYVQSEINMLMHVADSMGFTLNTFTHILEGYKVADKMAEHGAGASTFSDWWAYKYEVKDAIPHNAALLTDMGIVTAINSDDAEMGRRLNQEAAKAVKYGGATEEEAWKMVSLNPAKLLHLDDRMGSVKVGKDADIVIWTDSPLSVYSKVQKTIIDGVIYYDADEESDMRSRNRLERERILAKMMKAQQNGAPVRGAKRESTGMYNCIKGTE